ncbi:MAG: septum formation initiator family protein [Chloroflexota bacterium]|nr:septum formation initiator family protein [Chloroflexota bacterium]
MVRRPIGPPPLALRFAAVLVVPLLLYALVATGQRALDNYRLNQQTEALRAEVVGLRAENIQLQQDIERARTDAAIETIAREQLGLIKPGDHPVVLISSSPSEPAASLTPAPAPTPTPPAWRQWWDYVFS